ncbi:hypothetical protein I305_03910 [Cryptococcus gattii E566]|uniref:Uncharacterized protein n=2 Tax=Cryptococcus gattii TaxID=37769 RepID=E6R4R4_CRYGW|nr:Hypothetical Protein CGB_D8030W [Cryptococcus gattii WM276]ADV22072.1 Hypothetical Protein CGB_D8030W [Cryptococcus gattii WM276]KIR80473.1 hypothetical protein I306_02451 [Cryptococcus gattii EJB2]KIY33518.1 hypothetical protein I305_03910 [Cryptococcus gattii E566]KJE03411.1 hypothetical protein I311_02711 [Cryptococcus gattii NT-10]
MAGPGAAEESISSLALSSLSLLRTLLQSMGSVSLGLSESLEGASAEYGQVAKSGPSSLLLLRLALSSTVAVDDSEVQIDLQMVDA